MQHLQPNTTLQGGKYRIERVLGQGGFDITYLAIQVSSNRQVVIKEFFLFLDSVREDNSKRVLCNRQGLGLDCYLEAKEKSKQMAKHFLAIKNVHIVDVFDVFEENDTVYYVMGFFEGESLKELMNRIGHPMTEEEVSLIIPQLLDALKSIHDDGICHLDIRPSNIMIDKTQQIKLIDFGFKVSFDQMLEDKGVVIDTTCSTIPSYFPPELLLRQYQRIGPWTDFYLLGATIFILLTNQHPPFATDILDDNSEDKHFSLPLSAEVSHKMRSLILWLMNVKIKGRPQSVHEIQEFMAEPIFSSLQKTDCDQTKDVFESTKDQKDNHKNRFWNILLEKLFKGK